MTGVNLYTYTGIRSPRKCRGQVIYILETITGRGPATLTKTELIEATRNQAELIAVISAIKRIGKPCQLTIYTESSYVAAGIREWLAEWQQSGWVNKKGEPVANRTEWEELAGLLRDHEVSVEEGKEHSYRKWMQVQAGRGTADDCIQV